MVATASLWIGKALRMLGQAFVILLVTLALDFLLLATVFFGPQAQLDRRCDRLYPRLYIDAYDHDLAPNANSERAWGNIVYPFHTDRYGLRIGACAPGEADKKRPAIFAVGDSVRRGDRLLPTRRASSA